MGQMGGPAGVNPALSGMGYGGVGAYAGAQGNPMQAGRFHDLSTTTVEVLRRAYVQMAFSLCRMQYRQQHARAITWKEQLEPFN